MFSLLSRTYLRQVRLLQHLHHRNTRIKIVTSHGKLRQYQDPSLLSSQPLIILANTVEKVRTRTITHDMKAEVTDILNKAATDIPNYSPNDAKFLLGLIYSKTKGYRIPKDTLDRMLERIEGRIVELFPKCTTEQIIELMTELIEAKRNITNCDSFFTTLLGRNLTEQNIIKITYLVSENREYNNTNMISNMLNFLSASVRPDTVFFLFLMTKLQFNLNYPTFEQPSFITELTQKFIGIAHTLKLADTVNLIYAIKFLSDWRYDSQMEALFKQAYMQIADPDADFELVKILVQLTLTMSRDRGMTIEKEYLEHALAAIEATQNDDLVWKCVSDLNDLTIPSKVQIEGRLNQIVMDKLETTCTNVRERLRPMEHLALINAYPERMTALVNSMLSRTDLEGYEVIRLHIIQQYLQPGVPSAADSLYKQMERTRPVTILDSYSRSALRIYNLDHIKRLLREVIRRHFNGEHLMPPFESALISSYETPQLREYWWKELQLGRILASKMFISSLFHLLSSMLFKMRENHIELISHIYYNSGDLRQFVVKMIGLHIKLGKVLGPFFDSPKYVAFPFLRDLAGQRFFYREEEITYAVLRLLERLKLRYQTDSSYYALIAKTFRSHTTLGKLDIFSLRFYRKHIDTLVEKALLQEEHVATFLQHIGSGKASEDYFDRLKLHLYSKRMFRNQKSFEEINVLRKEIQANPSLQFMRLIFNRAKPNCNLTAQYDLSKDKILRLISNSLPNPNIEQLIQELPVGSINIPEFFKLLKGLEVARPSNRQFNWVLDHFEHLFSNMSDNEQNQAIYFFAKLGLKVEDALILISSTTKSLRFVESCYLLNFTGAHFVKYLKSIQPIVERQLQSMQFGEQLRWLPTLLSCILLTEDKSPQMIRLLEYTLQELVTAMRKTAPKQPRFTVLIDLLKHMHPDMSLYIAQIKGLANFSDRNETMVHLYNQYCSSLQTENVLLHLEEQGYSPPVNVKQKQRDQSSLLTRQEMNLFARPKELLVLLPKHYSLYGQPEQYNGEFALLLLFARTLLNKPNREVKIMSWQELTVQPQKPATKR